MSSRTEIEKINCCHCKAEVDHGNDLCRFCGKIIVPFGKAKSVSTIVTSGLQSLKAKISPMTADELDETLISADYSNPANPIWDD